MLTADKLNQVLADGATVVVATCYRTTEYGKKHSGWFFSDADGNLRVKSGKSSVCLSTNAGKCLLVAIKAYSN